MNNMKENDFKKILNSLKNIKDLPDNSSKEEINKATLKFEYAVYIPYYNNLIKGWFYPSEDIFKVIEFFIRIKDNEKIEKCVEILNKYYGDFLKKKFEELLKNEEYEKCNELKKYV